MTRVTDGALVHFSGADASTTLCGRKGAPDLLLAATPFKTTSAQVTCPDCATLYCRVKNAPWNQVETGVLHNATLSAVSGDSEKE